MYPIDRAIYLRIILPLFITGVLICNLFNDSLSELYEVWELELWALYLRALLSTSHNLATAALGLLAQLVSRDKIVSEKSIKNISFDLCLALPRSISVTCCGGL